jgi:hypothetical protein
MFDTHCLTRATRSACFVFLIVAAAAVLLAGCGGGGDGTLGVASPAAPRSSVLAASPVRFNGGVPDPGLLMLLVPDATLSTDPRVTAWIDAASEVGSRLLPITDSQFLALGSTEARRFAGLVLPDQIHSIADDGLLAAVRDYVSGGGRVLLAFDFAALTLNASNQPVYPIPKSRLSDLAGVDYVLYDALRDRTVGLGPVTAMRSTLRELLVPPGKSTPWQPPDAPVSTILASAGEGRLAVSAAKNPNAGSALDDAGLPSGQSLYLPVSPKDPGGAQGFDAQQFTNLRQASSSDKADAGKSKSSRRPVIKFGKATKGKKLATVTRAQLRGSTPISIDDQSVDPEVLNSDLPATGKPPAAVPPAPPRKAALAAAPSGNDTLDAYSGYLLGHLIYPSFVTTGPYGGLALAQAPDFGLAAGVNTVGAGKVLFVNMPLTTLKLATDALPMHGFLYYFVQHVLQLPRMSTMPNAVPGMSFNWHLDSIAAQTPTLALEQLGIFEAGLFSIDMTAGPDNVTPGDGLGWNLPANSVAQDFLRRMDKLRHAVGSHGGWIHDYYGANANEGNASTFLPDLILNRQAVDGVLGHATRGYSAPEGNNPNWAMDWLEQQGVVAAYFGGHTGLGATREYRDGALKNPALWVVPVTPQGLYATFDEFQQFNVPQHDVIDWYRALVDFTMTQNTHRMIYAHPPGAYAWLPVLQDLIWYTATKTGAKFKWYSMTRMADFMAKRSQVEWHQTTLASGAASFSASHPGGLKEMVWMLPKTRYLQPVVDVAGTGTVSDGGNFWLVKAKAVTRIIFHAPLNPAFVPS